MKADYIPPAMRHAGEALDTPSTGDKSPSKRSSCRPHFGWIEAPRSLLERVSYNEASGPKG